MPYQDFQEVPARIADWPHPRPGVWLLQVHGGHVYRIGQEPKGFLLMALNERGLWIGPGGHTNNWGPPPFFATAQDAVDAAVEHFTWMFDGEP